MFSTNLQEDDHNTITKLTPISYSTYIKTDSIKELGMSSFDNMLIRKEEKYFKFRVKFLNVVITVKPINLSTIFLISKFILFNFKFYWKRSFLLRIFFIILFLFFIIFIKLFNFQTKPVIIM